MRDTPLVGPAVRWAATSTGAASGTADGDYATVTGSADGTADLDRREYVAYIAQSRLTRAIVTIAGEAWNTLIGDVTVSASLEDPITYAAFTIADPRVAHRATDSISARDEEVEIEFDIGPPGGMVRRQVFRGRCEASPNDGVYRPRATFRAVSAAAEWVDVPGCVRRAGKSGATRGELLEDIADSTGVVTLVGLTNDGAKVQKPVDFSGTPVEFARRVGEVEGWWPQSDENGHLRVVSDVEILSGLPVLAFSSANYFAVTEAPPARVVTDWILTTTVLTDDNAPGTAGAPGRGSRTETIVEAGIDDSGAAYATYTRITIDQGVEVYREVEEWATFQRPGATLGALAFQIKRQSRTWSTYTADASGNLTTELTERRTDVYEMSGIPASVATGTQWATTGEGAGGYYSSSSSALILIERILETFAYNACSLIRSTMTRSGYYSAQVDPATPGNLYADGSYRGAAAYAFIEVEEREETWADNRFPVDGQLPSVTYVATTKKYVPVSASAAPNQAYPEEEYVVADVERKHWLGDSSGARYTLTSTTAAAQQGDLRGTGDLWNIGSGTRKIKIEPGEGPIPGPPSGSSTIPQVQQQTLVRKITIGEGTDRVRAERSELIEFAESEDELRKVAARRTRLALCATYDISHRMVPALKPGDPITLTDTARELDEVTGWVHAIERKLNILTGAATQVTTVKIPPEWP